MPKFIELVYTRFIQPYEKLLFITFLIIIFSVCAYYSYQLFFDKKPENRKINDIANVSSKDGILNVMFFHADWCPHCQKAQPEWNEFKKEYNTKELNGYTVSCVEVDCTNDENPQSNAIREQYKVESFPTVIATFTGTDGKPVKVDFEAKVNKNNLSKFIESISNNP